MVHLGSFLLAIVSKNAHFSHYCVSRVSWAPVESAHTGTWEWWGACCLSFWSSARGPCFQGGIFSKGKVIECVFYESTKQQKHQTTEGFPRFSIQILSILSSFPSFYSMNPETDLRLMGS